LEIIPDRLNLLSSGRPLVLEPTRRMIIVIRDRFQQHVYGHLLHAKIPKASKFSKVVSIFFSHLGSTLVKAAQKTLMKLTPEGISHGHYLFYPCPLQPNYLSSTQVQTVIFIILAINNLKHMIQVSETLQLITIKRTNFIDWS